MQTQAAAMARMEQTDEIIDAEIAKLLPRELTVEERRAIWLDANPLNPKDYSRRAIKRMVAKEQIKRYGLSEEQLERKYNDFGVRSALAVFAVGTGGPFVASLYHAATCMVADHGLGDHMLVTGVGTLFATVGSLWAGAKARKISKTIQAADKFSPVVVDRLVKDRHAKIDARRALKAQTADRLCLNDRLERMIEQATPQPEPPAAAKPAQPLMTPVR